jgi:hypothetical protein
VPAGISIWVAKRCLFVHEFRARRANEDLPLHLTERQMANPEAAVLPPQITTLLAQLTEAAKAQVAAHLASGIIAACGRPFSIAQAMELAHDIQFAMYPAPQYGHYKEWEKTKDARLNKVYGPID